MPQDQRDSGNPLGENVKDGLPESIKYLMGKAFKMSRGTIPRSSWNNSILGDLVPQTTPADPTRPTPTTVKLNQQNTGNLKATKPGGVRPKRSVKKRTYGDSSFEGYGEGYIDDEVQEADYNSIDGDNISRKRPKKVCNLSLIHDYLNNNSLSARVITSKVLRHVIRAMVQAW